MKLKILNLMIMSSMAATVFANQPNESFVHTINEAPELPTIQTKTEMLDLKPMVYSASEPLLPTVLTPIQPIHHEIPNVTKSTKQQKSQEVILTFDYDYLHSYDVPVHTQDDYERAKKFLERERERQNGGYPVYMPMYYR